MDLSNLSPAKGANRKRKRIGRGPGSGHGKTAGRGHKGRGARAGGNTPPGYEGGQIPLQRRLPKRGFHNVFRRRFAIINLKQIAKLDETVISPEILLASGVVKSLHDGLKILGDGDLAKAVTVSAHYFSQSARDKILKA